MKRSETKEEFEAERVECVAEADQLREQLGMVETHIQYIDQELRSIELQKLIKKVREANIPQSEEMLCLFISRFRTEGDWIDLYDFRELKADAEDVQAFFDLCEQGGKLKRVVFFVEHDDSSTELGSEEVAELDKTGVTYHPERGTRLVNDDLSFGYRLTEGEE